MTGCKKLSYEENHDNQGEIYPESSNEQREITSFLLSFSELRLITVDAGFVFVCSFILWKLEFTVFSGLKTEL